MINKVLIVVAIPTFFILFLFKTADTKKEVVINKIPNFLLIGTISSQDSHKALIKNKDTGVLRAYHKGDSIYSVNNKPIKIISINNCGITIDNLGKKEYLHCKKTKSASRANLSPYIPTPLARFKISLGQKVLKDDEFFSRFDNDINYFSIKNGIDPRLVKAVIKVESNFNPEAISSKKAMGIMQLIPSTAEDYEVENLFDAEDNLEGGIKLLSELIEFFDGDIKLALAAYNSGKQAVINHGYEIPPYPETIRYVKKVLINYEYLRTKGSSGI